MEIRRCILTHRKPILRSATNVLDTVYHSSGHKEEQKKLLYINKSRKTHNQRASINPKNTKAANPNRLIEEKAPCMTALFE